jgi:adenosylcobinamide kinase/adenosylcobinamide-phosphate guanylyltransferase
MSHSGPLILVTGPARSGKSEWAEQLAQQSGRSVVYVATASQDPTDAEWQRRIEQHRQRRPSHWQTHEVGWELLPVLQMAQEEHCLLVDSLGTWLASGLDLDEATWCNTEQRLVLALSQTPSQIILVAEETGWGVIPAYPLGRQFRDRLGRLIRRIAAMADTTYLVLAGHVLDLSRMGMPLAADSWHHQV